MANALAQLGHYVSDVMCWNAQFPPSVFIAYRFDQCGGGCSKGF